MNEEGYAMYDTTGGYFDKRLKQPVVSVNLHYSFRFYPRFGTVTGYIELWNLLNYTRSLNSTLAGGGITTTGATVLFRLPE